MSTANAYLTVAGLGVDVIYKDIKNMHISVYPPMGRVRVAAPYRLNEDAIRLAIVQRLPWIKKQREQLQNADRQTDRTENDEAPYDAIHCHRPIVGGVDSGRKSLALAVTLQPTEKVLTDVEIEAVSQKIVAAVAKATGAALRT